jgi:hypothetical protein
MRVLLVCAVLAGCERALPPTSQTRTINVIPEGTPTEIALACGRASVLLHLMTLGDWPPAYRYLDPRSMPGYDPSRRERNARAAEYLGEAIDKLGVWTSKIENDPGLLDRALEENGWTVIERGKKIAASDRSWRNLVERVDWCLAHYDVKVPEPAEPTTQSE